MEKLTLTKERISEIAYALLLVVLGEDKISLKPEHLKRNIGNLPERVKFLPQQFRDFSREELQEALRIIMHDVVEYGFSFDWKEKKTGRGNQRGDRQCQAVRRAVKIIKEKQGSRQVSR